MGKRMRMHPEEEGESGRDDVDQHAAEENRGDGSFGLVEMYRC